MTARGILALALLSCGPAQTVPTKDAWSVATSEEEEGPWAPAPPAADGFDWIQLKTGEWLKGRLEALQEEELEFRSEELDEQTFDWEKVVQVRSPRIQDLLFDDESRASGPIAITSETVTVGGPTPRSFQRKGLQSITPGGSRRNYWSGDIVLGLTLRSGNSSESAYNASAGVQRRTPATRFTLDYLGYFSRTEGTETANNHRVNLEFDRWLSNRFYVVVPYGEYFRDPFQNIADRYTLGAGVGYDVIDTSDFDWSLKALPAYQTTSFDSTATGEDDAMETVAFVVISDTDWDISERTELNLEYQGQLTDRENGGLHSHLTSTLEFDLTKLLELDVTFVWDRISDPQADSDGVTPKQDDFRLVLGFSLEF